MRLKPHEMRQDYASKPILYFMIHQVTNRAGRQNIEFASHPPS